MKCIFPLLPALMLATAASAQAPRAETAPEAATETATARFVDADGEANGTAELWQLASGGVLIRIEVGGLPEDGWVAFHVHETGSCDAATGHESAGGHFNPGGKDHGYMAANGPHAGDMPNQYVPEGGTLHAEVLNPAVTLAEGETGIRGRALMIHAKADDYKSQPSGDAGDRLACAVIE